MKELKDIIAEKLVLLRKVNNMTQSELAEKLNYSDKAISKWEHGESLPSIEVLYNIAQMYNVSLDYLTKEDYSPPVPIAKTYDKQNSRNRLIIALLAVSVVCFLATSIYVYSKVYLDIYFWEAFIWAIPVSCIVGLVFNSIWGNNKKLRMILISIFIWSLLTSFYLQFMILNLWPLFFMGVPMQIATILWSSLK